MQVTLSNDNATTLSYDNASDS